MIGAFIACLKTKHKCPSSLTKRLHWLRAFILSRPDKHFIMLAQSFRREIVCLCRFPMLWWRQLGRRETVSKFFNVLIVSLFLATFFTQATPAYAWWFWTPGDTVDNVGYKPEQPIPFSHKLHSGDRKIPCEYCHSSARRSFSSGVPSGNTCMGCHKIVRTDKPAIKKLTEAYEKNQPIEWVKVHDVPDFVRFPHKRHVQSKDQGGAGIQCQECHGKVEEMEVLEQGAPLQMGWCIGCHKERNAPLDCLACHY